MKQGKGKEMKDVKWRSSICFVPLHCELTKAWETHTLQTRKHWLKMVQIKHGKTPLTQQLETNTVKVSVLYAVVQWSKAISTKLTKTFFTQQTNKQTKSRNSYGMNPLAIQEERTRRELYTFTLQNRSQSYGSWRQSSSAEKQTRHQ